MNSVKSQESNKNRDPTGWLVICIFAVIITVIFCIIWYQMIVDIRAPQVEQRCPVGLCKFSVFTGIKTCPSPGDTLGVQLAQGSEFCTSADFCQNSNYQCAVLSNQTLNCDGVCDQPKCRCVPNPNDEGIVV
jgi:hypothetical protein